MRKLCERCQLEKTSAKKVYLRSRAWKFLHERDGARLRVLGKDVVDSPSLRRVGMIDQLYTNEQALA